ncbi:MAG: hypothetical protein KF732_05025 [Flavobacteriales bacterium]|nr:hypothetical protein [Flavobacteriales bacterium]
MKKLLLAVAFFSFVGLTYANPCEDGKKCDKKECSSKDAKKGCCSKDKATTANAKSSCSSDKTAGKSCCASKAKPTEEKKGE